MSESHRSLLDKFFSASAHFPSIESVDRMVARLCETVVESGAYSAAVVVVGDSQFRIRHVGASSTAPDVEALLVRLRLLEGRPMRPYSFGSESKILGAGEFIRYAVPELKVSTEETWRSTDQHVQPMIRRDGSIAGFLSLDGPQENRLPTPEDARLLEILIQHCVSQIESIEENERLRAKSYDLEQRVLERSTELRLAQERFSNFVNISQDVIYLTDENYRITYLNELFASKFGVSRENYLGRGIAQTLAEFAGDRNAAYIGCRQLESSAEDVVNVHMVLNLPDGRRTFDVQRFLLRQGGAVKGSEGTFRDITDQQNLLNHLLASERLAATGRLAASVAHEINNPLQAIVSQLNMLQSKIDQEASLQHLDRIHQGIDRIRQLVRGMLDLNRTGTLEHQVLNLNDVVNNVISLIRPQIDQAQVSAKLYLDSKSLKVNGLMAELQQMLLNLILNALEAMPDGGELTIRTQPIDKSVAIIVQDSGHGIQPEHLPRVFEPFFTRKSMGTGLGLYIAKGIAESHGGMIQVASTPGSGATFTVLIPSA